MTDDLDMHDAAWFADRIGMSLDWVRRNTGALPHHRIARRVKFDVHCVEAYRQRTAVNNDPMQRTAASRRRAS